MLTTTHKSPRNFAALVAAGLMLGLTSAGSLLAQTEPAPATAPAPAAAPAAPAEPKDASLEQRVNDLEQYFNNLVPGPAADAKPEAQYKSKLAGLAGPGHNGFLMICAALVLFMTLPGLALFYGGLVRSKNVLSVLAQCMGIAGLVTILWFVCGYSLVFAENGSPYLGDFRYAFLKGVSGAPNGNYTAWPSQATFSMYQLMFAIITPALIIGAIAERMKFKAVMLFVALWMFAVYFPMAHMVWGFDGLLNGVWNGSAGIPTIDFAGGTVVHMTSGWSALVLAYMVGKRKGFGKEKMSPHSMVLCMVGTGMLWAGWYGFNAGSALAADGVAANAFMTTTLAAGTAGFVWAVVEMLHKGKPSILGFCSGIVAGLVVITPACGFVNASGAMIIGILAGIVPYLAVMFLKPILKVDDALDTFGVHGVGGTMGAILSGVLVDPSVNSNLTGSYATANGLAKLVTEGGLVGNQIKAVLLTITLSVVASVVIGLIVKVIVGLRPDTEQETIGLDLSEHGEAGYEH